MNFDDAMASHIIWKLRLTRFINGSGGEDFDRGTVGNNEACDLGKWIFREGAKYQGTTAYGGLLKKHADFHRCAAEVIGKVDTGDRAGARAIIDGPFEEASRGIIIALAELRQQVAVTEVKARLTA
ncbi:MAG: CZB domain-containing protein [Sulfuritalea sp.]|nr:CZB domain-containing protein [Sulfuritalea sp.]MDP1981531.1 CZB domain-containing protein [Sulfuritalea sp.]